MSIQQDRGYQQAENEFDRPLPRNFHAERSVLGAILVDNKWLSVAQGILSPEDFVDERHKRYFGYMIDLDTDGKAIDLLTLGDSVERAGELEMEASRAYMASLFDGVPKISNVKHYADIVKEKSGLRSIVYVARETELQALEAEDDSDTIAERSASRMSALRRAKVKADWPESMAQEAFYGLAGDFVRLVEPYTEADRHALLGNFIVAAGTQFGREAYVVADGKKHFAHEFLLTVGPSGSGGRKGTASERALAAVQSVNERFFEDRVLGGLSSGEGLIQAIASDKGMLGESTRRHLAYLPEFASVLQVMKREGSTMSPCLRQAWDGDRLKVTTRHNPLSVDRVHLSVIAHVTPDELLGSLTATDRANGFANRFLIMCVRRSQCLAESTGDVNLSNVVIRLRDAIETAQDRGLLQRDSEAKSRWHAAYPELTADRTGMTGALLSRAEAHVTRLSLLYALLDGAGEIRIEHLRAALAFWKYCDASVQQIFGTVTGDPDAHKILSALAAGPMIATEVRRLFSNNRDTDWIEAKMASLVRSGRAVLTTKDGERKKGIPGWSLG